MRNSNIELLRIIAILGVFFLHFYNPIMGGGILLCKSTCNEFILRLIESQFVCSVNLFVLITGYFLSCSKQRGWLKPIQLMIQIILFNIAIYCILIITERVHFSAKDLLFCFLPRNWFVTLYAVLYIVSPYLNIIIDALTAQLYKKFIIILLFIFSICPIIVDILSQWLDSSFNGLSTIGMYGSQYGYTIVQFMLMYMIGGFLAKYPIQLSKTKILLYSMITVFIITGWSYIDKLSGYKVEPNAFEYCNPLVIVEAVLLFVLFLKFRLNSKIINRLSSACFTMYLLHSIAYSFIDIDKIVNSHPIVMVSLVLIIGIFTYLICFVIDYLYNLLTSPFFAYISRK